MATIFQKKERLDRAAPVMGGIMLFVGLHERIPLFLDTLDCWSSIWAAVFSWCIYLAVLYYDNMKRSLCWKQKRRISVGKPEWKNSSVETNNMWRTSDAWIIDYYYVIRRLIYLKVAPKPPLRPNIPAGGGIRPMDLILKIRYVFLRLNPSVRLDLEPDWKFWNSF